MDPLPGKTRRARYPFIAKVTIEHLKSGTLVDGITTDLSEGGCGVRVPELFSGGTRVLAKITKSGATLATPATVAYSLPPAAMGLAFVDMPGDQKQILAGWLKTAIPTSRRNVREDGPSRQVLPVYTTVVDSDRRYIEVSDSFCSLLGYEPKELIGKRYDDVSEPNINDIPTIFSLFSRLGHMHGLWMLLHRTGARVLVRYEAWLRADSCIEANMELVEWLTPSAPPGSGLTK